MRRVVPAVAALLAAATVVAGQARADHTQQSIFQDDNHLVYADGRTVSRTLQTLQSLGVQMIRVTVLWKAIAPDPEARRRPRHFDAGNPADYPAALWAPYDRVVSLAARHHIAVDFNITAPGPLWAMGARAPSARYADHWVPSATEFARFVAALGRRYSGSYPGPGGFIPRVRIWSIWNEPNQPGWLAPQWSSARAGGAVAVSPALYRRYLRLAYLKLYLSGHTPRTDTILIGELAPEGSSTQTFASALAPMPFLRALYCVGSAYRPLRGDAARQYECPARGGFRRENPALFSASGFAHHPYYFFYPPWARSPDPDFVPIANLPRLERGLDSIFRTYGVRRRMPLYLTEYGYQTNPPDPYQLVTPTEQAVYLNDADHMAWRDPRVRSTAQFLLYDSPPDSRFTPSEFGYWDTFQTGLLFASGRRKPAWAAYKMPIWIPSGTVPPGGRLFVWGQLRPADHLARAQTAEILWRGPRGGYRRLAAVVVRGPSDYFTARVLLPAGAGFVRVAWRTPSRAELMSREVAVGAG